MQDGSRQRSQFAMVAAAAHDLKTPLTFIRGAAADLTRTSPDSHQAQVQLERIEQSAARMLSLIDGVIGTAHSEQTQLPLEPVHVGDVVWEALENIKPFAAQHGYLLKTHFPRSLPPVLTNRKALERIIYNLVDNAIKYTRDKYEVSLSARRDHGSVRLSVRDYGVGIRQRDIEQIFSLFGTTAQPTQAIAGSSGLGLYIAHELSAAIHADIGAVPKRVGSSFYLRLPVARQLSLL